MTNIILVSSCTRDIRFGNGLEAVAESVRGQDEADRVVGCEEGRGL